MTPLDWMVGAAILILVAAMVALIFGALVWLGNRRARMGGWQRIGNEIVDEQNHVVCILVQRSDIDEIADIILDAKEEYDHRRDPCNQPELIR